MPIPKEKEIVIKAINQLGRRVSVSDIATKTGLPLNTSLLIINQIAAETGGHLQVSPSGDIAYLFPIGYQSRYITKGIQRLIEKFAEKSFALGFFLLRISFGIMLVLSLAIITIFFFAIVLSASKNKDDDNFSFDLNFFDWMVLRDLLWNFNYSTYPTSDRISAKGIKKQNFLYNCFSFLFGDGNPNAHLDERRWQAIAQLIREYHGSVTADQLAPYTGSAPDNDDAMLPVLVRFDGQPAVSESGNIIYRFPALQTTAIISSTRSKAKSYLNELPWQFSRANADSIVWIVVLATLNFLGGWWLFFETLRVPALSFAMPLLALLVTYGTAFVAVPIIRYMVIQALNKKIESRNKVRQEYAARLDNPNEKLRTKLLEAKTMQIGEQSINADDLAYDTAKSALEQAIPSAS
jgi:hypothetical protein